LLIGGVLLACLIIYMFRVDDAKKVEANLEDLKELPSKVPSISEIITDTAPVAASAEKKPEPAKQPEPTKALPQQPVAAAKPDAPLSIDLYSEEPRPILSTLAAPFGRLLHCKLVITVDSSKTTTPIIAIITRDLVDKATGTILVPAGTEAHSTASVDTANQRITSQTSWNLVWTDGSRRELPLSGLALDKDAVLSEDGQPVSWGVSDGSAGLRGTVIKTDKMAEIKILAAQFIQGLAGGLVEQELMQTGAGATAQTTVVKKSAIKDAVAQGVQSAAAMYAQQIVAAVQKDGFFIRVPAGSDFYLYVTQTLDADKATAGGNLYKDPSKTTAQSSIAPR